VIDGRASESSTDLSQGDLEIVPAMFEHAQKVYAMMARQATFGRLEDGGLLTYEGHLTGLFKELRLSVPYYTTIKNHLTAMGCIEQTRRGGGNGTSRWVLWKEPELEAWKNTKPSRVRHGNKQTIIEQMVKDMAARMRDLEAAIDNLKEENRALMKWTNFNE